MPFFLYQLAYSGDAIKAMVANPTDREAAARKLIEALGGKLHHLSFAFGQYDVVCLIEGPDDTMMMAGAAAVDATGTVSASATTKLMTSSKAMAALRKAGEATGAYHRRTGSSFLAAPIEKVEAPGRVGRRRSDRSRAGQRPARTLVAGSSQGTGGWQCC